MLEYIPPGTQFAKLPASFTTTCGSILKEPRIAYEIIGSPGQQAKNIILILTGMSTSAHVTSTPEDESCGWWEDMVGPGKYIDTNLWCVICVNNLGSCKGSTGPTSYDAESNKTYQGNFPFISI